MFAIILMKWSLIAFAEVSSLHASPEKTVVYFGSVKLDIQDRILQKYWFLEGDFPFKYLGMPITARRLTMTDCDVIVDKMLRRIVCWTSTHLSYAARMTLINSVLMSLHTYWAQTFVA